MKIFIGADHRGFAVKNELRVWLINQGYEVIDSGNTSLDENDDFPVFAKNVAREVQNDPNARGIVLCGSGVGVDVAANKVNGVRCSLGLNAQQVTAGRSDDDMNVLAFAVDFTPLEQIQEMIAAFLRTPFLGEERMLRRINQIKDLEAQKM